MLFLLMYELVTSVINCYSICSLRCVESIQITSRYSSAHPMFHRLPLLLPISPSLVAYPGLNGPQPTGPPTHPPEDAPFHPLSSSSYDTKPRPISDEHVGSSLLQTSLDMLQCRPCAATEDGDMAVYVMVYIIDSSSEFA